METLDQNRSKHVKLYRTSFILLLLSALAIRLIAAWVWQKQADSEGALFRFGDSESYWVLAESIARGTPYQYHSTNSKIFRVPTYPILLSTVAWIEPIRTAVLWARVLGCVLGTGCVALLYWATWQVARSARTLDQQDSLNFAYLAALASATFASFYLGAIGMSIFVLSEAVFCPLMLGSLVLLWMAVERSCDQLSRTTVIHLLLLGSGMLSGCAVLARPSWILWPGIVFAYCAVVLGGTAGPRLFASLRCTIVFCLGVALVMAPWWIRNYQVTGCFVPTTLQVGASLYDSFHAQATGASDTGMTFSGDFAKELAKDREQRLTSGLAPTPEDSLPFEVALDTRLRNAAIDWMQKNPSDAAGLSLVKFWRTWTPLPQAAQLGGSSMRIAEAVGYLAILLTALAAIIFKLPRWNPAILFALPCVYFATIHSVFVGSVRYRQPAVLALCVLAGIGTAWIVVKCKQPAQTKTPL